MIFLDSSYIIARLYKNQLKHNRAKQIAEYIKNEEKIINSTNLMEVMNSIKPIYNINSTAVLNNLLKIGKVHMLNKNDHIIANEMFEYYNYAINFQDCLILKTMKDNKINTIVSFDSDFDKIRGIHRIH